MKAYLMTTGLLFAALALVHIWRILEEWSRPSSSEFLLQMAVGIVLPGILCWWAWRLLRRLRNV